MMEIVYEKGEKIAGKGENTVHQLFLLFPQYFLWFPPIRIVLTLSQTTNFRRFQTETVCRGQFQI